LQEISVKQEIAEDRFLAKGKNARKGK